MRHSYELLQSRTSRQTEFREEDFLELLLLNGMGIWLHLISDTRLFDEDVP
jgi:hypothetical protein